MYLTYDFLSFVDLPGGQSLLVGSFRPDLVILSVVVAVCGAWAGLACLNRAEAIAEHRPGAGLLWKVAGGVGFGGSIWGMHFVGMLAFSLPCGIAYDFLTTFVSIVPGILASLTALFVVSRTDIHLHIRLAAGSVLMGAGIGTMHYAGMAAMRLPAILLYDPALVALSVVAAVVLSFVALAVVEYGQRRSTNLRARQLIGAIILGSAVASMHYIAMQAAIFYPVLEPPAAPGQLSQGVLALFVGLGTLALAGVVTAASFAARLRETARVLAEEVQYRQAAEKAARADQARLDAIFDTAAEGIVVIDSSGIIQRWSQSAQRIFGYTADEAIGMHVATLADGLTPAMHDGFIRRYEETRVATIVGNVREVVGKRKDGTTVPLELSVGETRVDDEVLYTGILKDISQRKKAEKELLEATRIREANELKSNFLAHMSHEMRTPLNAILGFSDIMRAGTFGPLSETYRNYADDIFSSGNHLLSLVDALLNLSKIESNAENVEITDVKLRPILEDAVSTLRPQAAEKNISISILNDNDLPEAISTDRGKLYQTLINLLTNAVMYTASNGRVSVRAWPLSDGIEIVVEDTGRGMTEDEIDLATKPFGQVKNAFTSDMSGTGLGLPIVVAFVAMLNGRLTITSRKGEGTTVSIQLPLSIEYGSDESRLDAS
ncbi:MAG: MHYT domain-containing protein [Rhodospirillales bacterium]